ncbi:DNA translocase FtsK [Desulforhopalus sp. IMCC35007]|uniref:DNA translocase FtsK n=1 Tax=Desulforhopalus sp. IMCC35007 TaxID=2569543 RepID=UPI0026D4A8F8|nr:DNA translocase FtsK [Desulforhopalus sp. IMCC35007]
MGINKRGFDYKYSLDQDVLILKTERGQFKFKVDNTDVLENIHDVASLIIKELKCVDAKSCAQRDHLNHYEKLLLATLNISEKHTRLEKKYEEVRTVLKELQALKEKLQHSTSDHATTRPSAANMTNSERVKKSLLGEKVVAPLAARTTPFQESGPPLRSPAQTGQDRSLSTQPYAGPTANQKLDKQRADYLQRSTLSEEKMSIKGSSVVECAAKEQFPTAAKQAVSDKFDLSISATAAETNSIPSALLHSAEETENSDTSKADKSDSDRVVATALEKQENHEKSGIQGNPCQPTTDQEKLESHNCVAEAKTSVPDTVCHHSVISQSPACTASTTSDIPAVPTLSVQEKSLEIPITEDVTDSKVAGALSCVAGAEASIQGTATANQSPESGGDDESAVQQVSVSRSMALDTVSQPVSLTKTSVETIMAPASSISTADDDVTAQTAELVESESVARDTVEWVSEYDTADLPIEKEESCSAEEWYSRTEWSPDAGTNREDTTLNRDVSILEANQDTFSTPLPNVDDPFGHAGYYTGHSADNDAYLEQQQIKTAQLREYQLPLLSFLRNISNEDLVDQERIRTDAELLETKLGHFGIKGEVMGIHPGPVITTYEYKPDPGIKISKIVNLADDLALALSAYSIRIVAPIPGKDVMGIEIPNIKKHLVPFKDIVTSTDFHEIDSKIPICLGKDIVGNPVVVALDTMPHLLIAGATGTGKSVGLNAMITSILYKATPDEVRFIMIDPKRIELSFYNDIPHLLTPVITDMNKANTALQWLVREMDRRYNLLAEFQVRNIEQFNQKLAALRNDQFCEHDEDLETMPYIVVIIDELADLMMTASRDIEFSLTRLAQMARAAGIHLILATQRPSVDVLTGIIKANFPTRISFQVSSKTDSRTIIDSNGAETLLGNGDMLFVPPGTARLTRVHGTYLSEDELDAITSFIKQQRKPNYMFDVLSEQDSDDFKGNDTQDEYDEKYYEALNFVVTSRQASISGVQRALRVGYNRAARIIDLMEKNGVIGPPDGAKPRKVFGNGIDRMGQP